MRDGLGLTPFDLIERRAKQHEVDFLSGLADTLDLCQEVAKDFRWPGIVERTLGRIETVLGATRGLDSVEALLRRPLNAKESCGFAHALASGQSSDVLLGLFERYGDDDKHFELLCCLLQEMIVLCGADMTNVQFAEKMAKRQHPLSWLPAKRNGVEARNVKRASPEFVPETTDGGLVLVREVTNACSIESIGTEPVIGRRSRMEKLK